MTLKKNHDSRFSLDDYPAVVESLTNLSSRTYHSGVDVVYHTALTDLMGRIRTVDADAAFAGLLRDEYVKNWTSLFEDIHL